MPHKHAQQQRRRHSTACARFSPSYQEDAHASARARARAQAPAPFHATHIPHTPLPAGWATKYVWQLICWLCRLSESLKNAVTCATATSAAAPLGRPTHGPLRSCSIETNAQGVRVF